MSDRVSELVGDRMNDRVSELVGDRMNDQVVSELLIEWVSE